MYRKKGEFPTDSVILQRDTSRMVAIARQKPGSIDGWPLRRYDLKKTEIGNVRQDAVEVGELHELGHTLLFELAKFI